MFLILMLIGGALMADSDIPTVTLCDLARQPGDYFDKPVRLTAVFEQWTEGQYLTDERCPLSHDDQIGVGWAPRDETERLAVEQIQVRMHSPEYENKSMVTVVGRLRNESARHFYWYGTRFDIATIESARPLVTRFTGELTEGWIYRAQGLYQKESGLTIEPRVQVPFHHAGRVEWTNPNDIDRLSPVHPSNRRGVYKPTVVFRVLSKQVAQAGSGRWNTTFTCELLRLE